MREDTFENTESDLDYAAEDIQTKTEMELYLESLHYLEERIEGIRQEDGDLEEKYDRMNRLRHTSYLANSSFFSEIFENSLKKSPLGSYLDYFSELVEFNKTFFKDRGLNLRETASSMEVLSGDKVICEAPRPFPDQILEYIGITEDNCLEYHVYAGLLLSPEVERKLMTAKIISEILKTKNKSRRKRKGP